MRPVRRVIVSTHDSLAPNHGGGALRTLKCAQEFHKRGFEVIIIAPTDEIGELHGIQVHWLHAPRKQRSQILSSLKFNVRLLRKFLFVVRNADMFFVHNTIAAATIPFLKMLFGFRFVLDITDIHAEYLLVGERSLFEKCLVAPLLWVEYWIIRAADCVIVESEAMRKVLLEHGLPANRVHVVFDGAELDDEPQLKTPDSGKNIIHLGSIDRQHGVEFLIKAIPKVLQHHSDAHFYLVGGGRELPRVRRLARTLGVGASCTFTGFVPFEQTSALLARNAIGVIPRPDYLPNRIVTTLKIFEYWLSGTAVVASELDAIAEIAEHGRDVVFFKAGSADDLGAKLIDLLDHPETVKSLQENGRQSVRRFPWSKMIPKIVDLGLAASETDEQS